MNKEAYMAKYAAAMVPVTDDTTVRELKQRKAAENTLRRFWKTGATRWVEQNIINKPMDEWLAGWHDIEFIYNIKPTGTVRVRLFACDERQPPQLIREVTIPKRELLTGSKG